MYKSTEALYADLAKALGVDGLPAGDDGSVAITVGNRSGHDGEDGGADDTVLLFVEDEHTVMLVSPVMALPASLDYGRVLWLLQRNFHQSPLAPFRVACDQGGGIVIWGRMPVAGLTGQQLAGLIEAVAAESALIREEIEIDE